MTPSMLSGWELGRRQTSVRYRRMLVEFYKQPAESLFAHQDVPGPAERRTIRAETGDDSALVLVGHHRLHDAMLDVVCNARRYLVVTGSRSRDGRYLTGIEEALRGRPELVHYRVLFGPPRHPLLRDHLLTLLKLRDPEDRSQGFKTLHMGIVEEADTPEKFICASENAAVTPIPSLTSADAFDSAVLLGATAAQQLIGHVRECYAAARRIESTTAVDALPVLRAGRTPASGV
ncbi:XRE family transcriptional regulator [Allostreptomyces psammosilenae]|uniref:Uncharacterized protein n=1 Tax=Allostreptomyces psammosilenae TaxID=1892865 RepID=A0A853A073_9ACTN|nr:XRE family transcriptional regulator [Allostreptomyces psammosilenae]NYI07789.1 hypothetical protein [Allostreptomyces psammosilenae]